jgi:hypothetical protein
MAKEFGADEILSLMKLAQWEKVKGELRALIELYADSKSAYDEMLDKASEFMVDYDDYVTSERRKVI